MINRDIKKQFAVIGNPIEHSKSPIIHEIFAKEKHISLYYYKILANHSNFHTVIKNFLNQGGLGLNVTLPFKQLAYDLSDNLSENAKKAMAVNTLTFRNSKIYGDNTDGSGFIYDIEKNHSQSILNKSILIFGFGGATRGILGPIIDKKPSLITIVNRSEIDKGNLYNQYNCSNILKINSFDSSNSTKYDLVINATSAGKNNGFTKFPTGYINSDCFCYDLSYSDRETEFINWAKKQGAKKMAQGIGMLIEQAADSFNIWHGIRPNTKNIKEKI
mgnify:CR=1 FL=1|tara:strand:- start:13909 stop:14730 length:822 start_codon:yes stop_codon:yes gene_type:complete